MAWRLRGKGNSEKSGCGFRGETYHIVTPAMNRSCRAINEGA
jgi:hypothetical protein